MLDRLAERLRLCVDVPSILNSTLDSSLALAGTNHGNIQLVAGPAGI
jgi:hypothetical protein